MKKFSELSINNQKASVYLLSILLSIVTYPLFFKLYQAIYHPIIIGGDLFRMFPIWLEKFFISFIFALYFYLAFFVYLLIKKDQLKVWLWGALIPLIIALLGGAQDLLMALILTLAGGLIGWLINIAIKKFKK